MQWYGLACLDDGAILRYSLVATSPRYELHLKFSQCEAILANYDTETWQWEKEGRMGSIFPC